MYKNKTKILVVGYPKSGNTWLTRLVSELLDSPSIGFVGFDDIKQDMSTEGLNRESEYVVLKSHLKYDKKLMIKNEIKEEKTIYIIRDIRDIVVSSYFYFKINIDKIINSYISGKSLLNNNEDSMWGRWDEHIYSWKSKSLVVKYEDLLFDTYKEANKIISYLGFEIDKNKIKSAIVNQSFYNRKKEFLKKNEITKYKFMRKGKAGEYKEILSEEQNKRIKEAFLKTIEEMGYEI